MIKDTFDYVIAIVTALGSVIALPLTIISIVKLIKKDKQKQEQIDRLVWIAEELKSQNETMVESNKISSEQVSILAKFATQSAEAENTRIELMNLEKRKHKLSIRPDIKISPEGYVSSNQYGIIIRMINHFANAYDVLVSPNLIEDSLISVSPFHKNQISIGEKFMINLSISEASQVNGNYEFDITFNDVDKNKYSLKVRGQGTELGFNPILEMIQ